MKNILIVILLVLLSVKVQAMSYAVGVRSDKINFWRFWEKKDTTYTYKIMVVNISDSTIHLKLQQLVFTEESHSDTEKNKVYVDVNIAARSYRIFGLPVTPINEFTVFYVDGQDCGMLNTAINAPPKDILAPFVSREILNGRSFPLWVSKNKLVSSNNQNDSLSLYLNYEGCSQYYEDGFYSVSIKPYQAFEELEVKSKTKPIGRFDVHGKYLLELPYYGLGYSPKKESNNLNKKIKLDILYKLNTDSDLFIGLESYCSLDLLKENKVTGKLEKGYSSGINLYLPVMLAEKSAK